MNQDIIEMAEESGLLPCQGIHMGDLKAFAKLVAAHTLMNIDPSSFMSHQEGIEAGRLAEREACAKYVEGLMVGEQSLTVVMGAIADGIRTRGEA